MSNSAGGVEALRPAGHRADHRIHAIRIVRLQRLRAIALAKSDGSGPTIRVTADVTRSSWPQGDRSEPCFWRELRGLRWLTGRDLLL